MTENFRDKVLSLVCRIPRGKVTTYKQLAHAAGKSKAYRAVGNILSKNPDPYDIPCHRVVRSDGKVGGYQKGRNRKEELLREEGVTIQNGKVSLEKHKLSNL